jgi:hypothetical protein
MTLVHPQENAIQKLHWKFEVNRLNNSWDIAHAITAIGGFLQFEKNCFKVEHIDFQNNIHL